VVWAHARLFDHAYLESVVAPDCDIDHRTCRFGLAEVPEHKGLDVDHGTAAGCTAGTGPEAADLATDFAGYIAQPHGRHIRYDGHYLDLDTGYGVGASAAAFVEAAHILASLLDRFFGHIEAGVAAEAAATAGDDRCVPSFSLILPSSRPARDSLLRRFLAAGGPRIEVSSLPGADKEVRLHCYRSGSSE
jgi:hypothetical protein